MSTFAIALYDVVLFVHILAVLSAFGAILAYPLFFAVAARAAPAQRAGIHGVQARIGSKLMPWSLLVVILAGAYMASDRDYWAEPWVSIPLLIAIVVGGVGGAVLAPRERKLAELADGGDQAEYERTLKTVKTAGGLLTLLVVIAIFLMTTKPG
ncbi:MAG: hypothetical protein AVDCRST_MAG30-3720 [uncultured Solirubrobacteraceae bacterium]|uniref:DUF2269 family protein n=1 Tax=uncultured Solirubrobacteraceae bacterium TaxID=1162706 RepID=A0A6J4TRF7_9ACTN|nr:MAG: hypothetical protein AVDCRST_MAG30-3720 [uncultured Solirubrobacteraceae bacterium]